MTYQPKTYRKQGGDEFVVADGGKITVESGGTLEVQAGATMSVGDGTQAVGDFALARGSVVVGNSSGVGSALDAKSSGKVLVGDGTDLKSVAISGDATLAANGALTIGAGAVTSEKLANGAGLAALLAAGLGASAAYDKTTNGAQTLLASDAAARVALIVVVVDETFADGDGGQTTFTIGEVDTADKYAAAAVFTGATAGDVFVLAGTLTASKNLIVTGGAATGTGTGGISATALVLPAAA